MSDTKITKFPHCVSSYLEVVIQLILSSLQCWGRKIDSSGTQWRSCSQWNNSGQCYSSKLRQLANQRVSCLDQFLGSSPQMLGYPLNLCQKCHFEVFWFLYQSLSLEKLRNWVVVSETNQNHLGERRKISWNWFDIVLSFLREINFSKK